MQGLEILNDSGNIQISSDFLDMAVTDIRYVANREARSSASFFAVMGRNSDFISPTPYMTGLNNGAGYVYDFTLDYLDAANKDKLGLELYGADGAIYYNSNYRSISVIDKVSLSLSRSIINDNTIGFTKNYGAKKVAVILMRDIAHFEYRPYSDMTAIHSACFNQDASGILNVKTIAVEGMGGYPPEDANTLEFLVIDVTNY